MRPKVLILDAEVAAGAECIQSLGRAGAIVHAASVRQGCPGFHSRYLARRLAQPGLLDDLVAWIIRQHSAESYNLIIPATEVSLLAFRSGKMPAAIYEAAVLAPRQSLTTALDKESTWQLAQHLGILSPSSELLTHSSAPPRQFPVVLKPVHSKQQTDHGAKDYRVTIVRDQAQWIDAVRRHYPDIAVQQQAYISGTGIGVEMLFERGNLRWSFMHRRVHELPITGGGSSYRCSIPRDSHLIAAASLLLSSLEWHGVAMVEFKVAPDGRAYLMEINPRLWGSLALAIDAGVDFPAGLLALAMGKPLPADPCYKLAYYTRNVQRDFEWFKANIRADRSDPLLVTCPRLQSALELLRPLCGKESWDFFSFADPTLIFGEVARVLAKAVKSAVSLIRRRALHVYLDKARNPRVLGRARSKPITTVLFICYGNICRSPLAEALALKYLAGKRIASSGFYAKEGRTSPRHMQRVALDLGVDISRHRSRRCRSGDIDDADLIVIMDLRTYRLVVEHFPAALSKTVFLGSFLPTPVLEIEDPYELDHLRITEICTEIHLAVRGLAVWLQVTTPNAPCPPPQAATP